MRTAVVKKNVARGIPGRGPKHGKDRAGLKGNQGAAKKGGGGGKYTWGKPGDELTTNPRISARDPNYDSQEENDDVMFVSSMAKQERAALLTGIRTDQHWADTVGNHQASYSPPRNNYSPDAKLQRPAPLLSLSDFKANVVKIMREYFLSGDLGELSYSLSELNCPQFHYEFVRRSVTMAMERKSRGREMVSVMLNELRSEGTLAIEHVGKGFERLFEVVDDLELDTPGAKKLIAQYLARAVVDEVLPPSFLVDPRVATQCAAAVNHVHCSYLTDSTPLRQRRLVEGMGGEMVEQAKVLLSIKHGMVRLENVWGRGEGSSVADLKSEIKILLNEYATSYDVDEAVQCIQSLNVPHFHHEIVKRAARPLSCDARTRDA